jgi:hypothetical protein
VLEKAALINPRTAEELKDIKGFGLEKFSLYAEEMVKALRSKKTS